MCFRRVLTFATILTLGIGSIGLAQGNGQGNGPGNGPGYGQGNGPGNGGCQGALVERFDLLAPEELDDDEIAAILFLKEEEKLARDVYATLALEYDIPIFSNIARSESRHMGLVDLLIGRYQLADPVHDDSIGVFTNPDIAGLYSDLVAEGRQSLIDGLIAGATIEDMDLADLYDLIDATDNLDIALIAHNLAKGSRNHLRAFVQALGRNGASYEAQYLDADEMAAILASDPERGVIYDELGDVLAQCGGPGGRVGGRGNALGRGPYGQTD
jgi:hypothetical protein